QFLNPDSLVLARGAVVEPALQKADPGARFQFVRLGYFCVDTVDSKPGAPVFNRTITLRDTWAKPAEKAEEKPRRKEPQEKKSATPRKGRAEVRAELRAATPELEERYARYQQALKLPQDEADLLTGDLALARFFDAALAEHANPAIVSKWLVNELLAALKDRPLEELPIQGDAFGRFARLVDEGRITQGAAKTLLAELVKRGGEPEALVKELGLEKVDDTGAVEQAIAGVFQAHAAEVERYRAGEKKLLGVLIGAAMKATRGAADATVVRKLLVDKLEA
ncbi:MAG: glutamine--tRNA ligase, partial [Myxococcales bacterium]